MFCKGCHNQLKFARGEWVVAKERKGKWIEIKYKRPPKEGIVKKDEKILFKCLICGSLNELPEDFVKRMRKNNL